MYLPDAQLEHVSNQQIEFTHRPFAGQASPGTGLADPVTREIDEEP